MLKIAATAKKYPVARRIISRRRPCGADGVRNAGDFIRPVHDIDSVIDLLFRSNELRHIQPILSP